MPLYRVERCVFNVNDVVPANDEVLALRHSC